MGLQVVCSEKLQNKGTQTLMHTPAHTYTYYDTDLPVSFETQILTKPTNGHKPSRAWKHIGSMQITALDIEAHMRTCKHRCTYSNTGLTYLFINIHKQTFICLLPRHHPIYLCLQTFLGWCVWRNPANNEPCSDRASKRCHLNTTVSWMYEWDRFCELQ